MKFFDDKNKNVNKWNRNYFYIGTIIIILINILLFELLGDDWNDNIMQIDNNSHWEDLFYFNPIIVSFF